MIWILLSILVDICVPSSGSSTHLIDYTLQHGRDDLVIMLQEPIYPVTDLTVFPEEYKSHLKRPNCKKARTGLHGHKGHGTDTDTPI